MTRFKGLTVAALLFFAPALAHAETPDARCTPAQAAAAKLSASGLSCTQWVANFAPERGEAQTARNDRAPAPHS